MQSNRNRKSDGRSRLWKVSYYEKFIAAHPINLSFSDCATLHKTS